MSRDLDYRPCERRELRYQSLDGSFTGKSSGDSVYSVCPSGVIIAVSKTRILIPWHRVIDLSWDVNDNLTETLHKL